MAANLGTATIVITFDEESLDVLRKIAEGLNPSVRSKVPDKRPLSDASFGDVPYEEPRFINGG
jgi:hypothetical protein